MLCYCSMAFIAIIYMFFDVNYFIRLGTLIYWRRLFEKKKKLGDATTIYGLCATQDMDVVFKHMNNARYLRELDFARFHYYDATGLYNAITERGGSIVQGACSVRYRQPLTMFTPYKVVTKLIYWEEKHLYMEHEFITLSDNLVRTVIFSKQSGAGIKVSISDVIAKLEPNLQRPEIPADLKLWVESLQQSSAKYRKQN